MSIMRTVGMFALGVCTLGLGFLYILARTRWIEPGNVGIVVNYGTETATIEKLDPGVHTILSPFRSFKAEISTQTQTVKQKQFEVKTHDNFDALVKADYWYKVEDPNALILNVKDGEEALRTTAESALASVLQEYDYQDLTSSSLVRDAKARGPEDKSRRANTALDVSLALFEAKQQTADGREEKAAAKKQSVAWNEISQKFIEKLQIMCQGWGVKFFGCQLVSVEVEQDNINKEIAQAALIDYQNRSRLKAAQAKSEAVQIEAEGEAKANERLARVEVERARACKLASDEFKGNPEGMAIFMAGKRVETAQAISRGGRNVNVTSFNGNGEESFSAAPFAFIPAPSEMDRGRGTSHAVRATVASRL